MRAEDKLWIYGPLTLWAERQIIQVLKQVFLLQCPLKCLVQRLLRSQDQIQQESGHKEQNDEKGGENLSKDASAPGLNIPKGPGNEREPKGDEIGNSDR
jgi:hypothetical protein